jgi:hypothetical protein
MAFISQNVTVQGKEEQKTPPSSYVLETVPHLKLDKLDIEILLSLIKDSTFKGRDIQVIYDLVLKLQDYYEQIT